MGLLTLSALLHPQVFIIPIGILAYLYKEQLRLFLGKYSLPVAFIGCGILFGLLTEFTAILEHIATSAGQKTLLHPNPVVGLVMGFFYYGTFTLTWYLLLSKRMFSKKAIFFLSGTFGLVIEHGGVMLGNMLFHPLSGMFPGLLLMAIYGIFPLIAYFLNEARFPERHKPLVREYLLVIFCLLFAWAVYENTFHKALLFFFP